MIDKQITVPGDWQMKRPNVRPGGWAFQYDNDFYPDLDDTAMVLMALHRVQGLGAERTRRANERGLGWFLGMQGKDGGWASFDADNNAHLSTTSRSPITGRCSTLHRGSDRPGPRAPGRARLSRLSPRRAADRLIRRTQPTTAPGTAAGA